MSEGEFWFGVGAITTLFLAGMRMMVIMIFPRPAKYTDDEAPYGDTTGWPPKKD